MRQHLRQSRPGRPCGAPARRSRGRPPPGGKTGAGSVIGSKNRGRGAVPLPADLGAGGRSRRSERPSARTRRGVGEPALRPASIGFDKTRGGAGGAASRPGPPDSGERIRASNSGKLDRAPVSIPLSPSSASWTGSRYAARSLRPGGAPAVEPVGRSSRAGGGLRHVPDRQDDLPRAEVIRPRQISQRSPGLLPLGLGRPLAGRHLE
jgi:hypothetical protein